MQTIAITNPSDKQFKDWREKFNAASNFTRRHEGQLMDGTKRTVLSFWQGSPEAPRKVGALIWHEPDQTAIHAGWDEFSDLENWQEEK